MVAIVHDPFLTSIGCQKNDNGSMIPIGLAGLRYLSGNGNLSFTIGGSVVGPGDGQTLTLKSNTEAVIILSQNGGWSFPAYTKDGASDQVDLVSPPSWQDCFRQNGR